MMRSNIFFFITLVGITILINDAISSPIFSVEVDRLKSRDGKVTLLQYIDIPEGIKESVDLNCGTPSGTKYDWNIYSKMGAPHAGHMSLGKPTPKDIDVPYITTIRQHEYPWTLLLVTCDVYMESENKSGKDLLLLTYAWIIMKMKSSTDRPFHPIICEYDDAQCVRAKHDCMYDKYGYDYRGQHDRTSDGIQCQPWGSRLPNYAERMDGTDTFGGHRYCRNAEKTFKTQPICVWNVDSRVDPVAIGSEGKYKLCTVPKCHDCMYGRGNGEYPGTVPYTGDLAEAYAYPKYGGKNGFTKIEAVNARGKTTYQKCHRGKNEYWNDNNCRVDPKVGSRRPHDRKANLRCLGIPDLTKDETDFPEDPHWSRYKWVDCIVPQCTVRQVWFLLVTDDNKPLFNVDNSRHFEITVMNGITKTIRFYHFGTTFCKGMRIETERNLQPFLKAFTIRCKPTPQLSEFEIRSPTRDYEGNYNLKYTFPEGDEHIESMVYKMNFKLVVKNPTTISLTKTEVCPGYPTETQLEVHGSFKLESNSIEWYYRDKNQDNGDKWSSIETLSLNNFELSVDEKRLRLKRLKDEIELKVNAKSTMGSELTAQVDVKILSEPRLTVQEPNIVAELDKPIKMSVECDSKAKTTWIFEGQVLSDNHGDYNMRSIMNENDETVRTDTLSIRAFRPSHEGIYTVIVENEKCKTIKDIFVTVG